MRNNLKALLVLTACLIALSACGWSPPCPPVAITAPWDKLNLPVQENAAVCASAADKFQAAHKGSREEVARMYLDALDKAGWKLTKKEMGDTYHFDFEKGGEKIAVEVYDWKNTGVLIKRQ